MSVSVYSTVVFIFSIYMKTPREHCFEVNRYTIRKAQNKERSTQGRGFHPRIYQMLKTYKCTLIIYFFCFAISDGTSTEVIG